MQPPNNTSFGNQNERELEEEDINATLSSLSETLENTIDNGILLPIVEDTYSTRNIAENALLLKDNGCPPVELSGDEDTKTGSEISIDKHIGSTLVSLRETIQGTPKLDEILPQSAPAEDQAQQEKIITQFVLTKISRESRVLDPRKESRLAKFHSSEIFLGDILGEGGFGTVFEVKHINIDDKGIKLKVMKSPARPGLWKKVVQGREEPTNHTADTTTHKNEEDDDIPGRSLRIRIDNQDDARLFIATHYCRPENPGDFSYMDEETRYALKRLSPRTIRNKKRRTTAVVDLAIESRFLSSIEHPNIVKLRGLAKDEYIGTVDFFIVMDKLYETLEDKIHKWSWIKSDLKGSFIVCCRSTRLDALWEERVRVAYDIASAFRYLHGLKIIYRDLKPENVGFDIRGDVKIFDFGLAKELKPEMIVRDDSIMDDHVYKLTGRTGTLRYMAPEVVNKLPYNHKCDVFSFGIVFWEICAVQHAFSGFNSKEHMTRVVQHGERPNISDDWPCAIKNLIKLCWTESIKERCDFKEIYSVLRKEVVACAPNEKVEKVVARLDHRRRRSTYVQAFSQPLEPKRILELKD